MPSPLRRTFSTPSSNVTLMPMAKTVSPAVTLRLSRLLRDSEAMGMSEPGIRFDWEIENVERGSDDAIPIALFVLEAVTNAVKYAFENNGGVIKVSLKRTEEHIVLTVRDDGVGIAEDKAASPQTGLGSRLMNAFAKQLRAKLTIESEKGDGVAVKLELPIASA